MAVSRLALEGELDLTRGGAVVHRGGHDADFDRLYNEHSLRVIGLVRRFIADEDLVDDIVQEAFFRAYHAGLHLEYRDEQERDPWPWLAAVARNLSLDSLRKKRSVFTEDLEIDITETELSPDDPEAHHLATRRRAGIAEALDAVCPRQRRVLIMKHIYGLQYQDIAEQEGMTVEALKSVLARARRTFKDAYSAIAERSGLGVVLGGAFSRVQSKLRALRNRVTTAPDTAAQAMAASPAAANTLTTLVVLGTVGVVGAVLGSDNDAPPPAPIVSVAPDAAPVVRAPAPTPMSGVDIAPAPAPTAEATVAPAPTEPTVEAASAPAAPAPNSGGTDVGGSVDTNEVVPVEDPPAGGDASGSVEHDPDDGKVTVSNDASVDTPVQDIGVEHDAWVDCPPPERRTALGSVVCPVLNDEESSPTNL